MERDSQGKEIRYPVILTAHEKSIAHSIVSAFGVSIRFSLFAIRSLAANGVRLRSTACRRQVVRVRCERFQLCEDIHQILRGLGAYSRQSDSVCAGARARHTVDTIIPAKCSCGALTFVNIASFADDPPVKTTPSGKLMELRCVLAVIRHGDRTPKQKLKMGVTDER